MAFNNILWISNFWDSYFYVSFIQIWFHNMNATKLFGKKVFGISTKKTVFDLLRMQKCFQNFLRYNIQNVFFQLKHQILWNSAKTASLHKYAWPLSPTSQCQQSRSSAKSSELSIWTHHSANPLYSRWNILSRVIFIESAFIVTHINTSLEFSIRPFWELENLKKCINVIYIFHSLLCLR